MSKCGEKTEVYSRVCGYFRPVANWNKGKKEEFKDRKTFKVTGVLLALFATATLFLLTGCGHNVATFSKGIRAVAGINPDTYTISIGIDYGENVTIAVKEKAEAVFSGETTGGAGSTENASGEITTGSRLSIQTGDQTNGYVVELEKAKSSQLNTQPPPEADSPVSVGESDSPAL